MTWSLREWLRPQHRVELDEEVRQRRGELAQAVITNDRKATELRLITAGALRLREELDK